MSPEELRAEVASLPRWWHSIELGDSVVTPGHKDAEALRKELDSLSLPDLAGRTVLDVGAWDGYFSFAAERLGAARVVALDHYVWSIDMSLPGSSLPPGVDPVEGRWNPEDLPGKRPFDLAHRVLGSRVEPLAVDFMEADLDALGRFDVVLYLGVLYHMRHPLLALERLARVTGELAVIETDAVWVPGREDQALCEFHEGDGRGGDPTNWWVPNAAAVLGMCRSAGFEQAEVVSSIEDYRRRHGRRPPRVRFRDLRTLRYRLVVHARRRPGS